MRFRVTLTCLFAFLAILGTARAENPFPTNSDDSTEMTQGKKKPKCCPIGAFFNYGVNDCTVYLYGPRTNGTCNIQEAWIIEGASSIIYGSSVNYSFPSSGTYSVCHVMTVRGLFDQILCTDTVCQDITVTCPPNPCCDLQPDISIDTVNYCFQIFNLNGSNNGTSCASQNYEWTLTNYTPFNLPAPFVYNFSGQNILNQSLSDGIYDICLTIYTEDAFGNRICENTTCLTNYYIPNCARTSREATPQLSRDMGAGNEAISIANTLVLYPNPIQQGNVLSIKGLESSNVNSISLMNNLGQVIETYSATSNAFPLSEDLPSGVYFIKVETNSEVITKSIIVN